MTREEAIAKMEQQKNAFLDEYVDYGGVTEAYNMAISALEAQVPCEDAVSRKAAVEKIRRYGVGSFDFELSF